MPHCDLGFTLTQFKQNLSVESSYFQIQKNKIGIGERRRTMRVKMQMQKLLFALDLQKRGA